MWIKTKKGIPWFHLCVSLAWDTRVSQHWRLNRPHAVPLRAPKIARLFQLQVFGHTCKGGGGVTVRYVLWVRFATPRKRTNLTEICIYIFQLLIPVVQYAKVLMIGFLEKKIQLGYSTSWTTQEPPKFFHWLNTKYHGPLWKIPQKRDSLQPCKNYEMRRAL